MLFFKFFTILVLVIFVGAIIWKHVHDINVMRKPHIIIMMADDYGWNDVGFRNDDVHTPHIDLLAANGIILNQSYVQNVCTPSRSALLTGRYPFKTGMQRMVIPFLAPIGLPTQFQLLPQKLKELGYSTHIIGKWHLGSCHEEYWPINRGFDTFFGHLSGGVYYYDHSIKLPPSIATAEHTRSYDFWNQTELAWQYYGTYSSIPFVEQVRHVLKSVNPDVPLFMFVPFQLPHSPLQVPEDKLKLYQEEQNTARKTYKAMVSQMDSDIGQIIHMLKQYDFYDNSVLLFTSDNGGELDAGGNNWPLMGGKNTLYEGGHRATAFVHSPFLIKTGFTYNGLVHLVDWFPTFVALANGQITEENLDGINMWPAITKNEPSPRTEIIYNLENNGSEVTGAIRIGDWKLIVGKAGLPNARVLPRDVTGLFANISTGNGNFLDVPNYPTHRLFNLQSDPYEEVNLAEDKPDIVNRLLGRINHLKLEMVHPVFVRNTPAVYQQLTENLTYINTNWCEAISTVKAIEWSKM